MEVLIEHWTWIKSITKNRILTNKLLMNNGKWIIGDKDSLKLPKIKPNPGISNLIWKTVNQ